MGLFTRAIRPPDDIVPNSNDPASVPPSTVGPDQLVVPGDPEGVVLTGEPTPAWIPPTIIPSPWSGWPGEWWTPLWGNQQLAQLTDTAWMCLDLTASVLATMPPYLVKTSKGDPPESGWMANPQPETYASWEEFLKGLAWDYQLGEAFVIATSYYATGWPSRFHVVPPWAVEVDMVDGRRRYKIGREDVTGDMLHIRYQGSVDDAHGHGPLEAGRARLVAASALMRYATTLVAGGGIPSSILKHPERQSPEQARQLQTDWVAARLSKMGEPAVLSGGIEWQATQMNPKDMALVELANITDARIAVLLGVPPFLVGLPSGGDSLTYSTTAQLFDYYWRSGLRPKAASMMAALSGWLLPRGTRIELNRDEFVQPGPLERAQTAEILNRIVDAEGNPALSVQEIRDAERFDNSTPDQLASGVLK